jgi:argininosuccinate lyase
MVFDPEYVARVLRENFEDAKVLFLSPLVAINYAHLLMLRERRIVTAADARALRDALDSISIADVRSAQYDLACEDLFFFVERKIVAASGEEIAGRRRIARSRNDIDKTM